MSLRISLVSEQHGYTIRLERIIYEVGASIEKAETIACLAIINDVQTSIEVFKTLDRFIHICVENKIIEEEIFRHGDG